MNKTVSAALFVSLLILAGCATAKGPSSLESRVQALENRIGVLEGDVAVSSPAGSMDEGVGLKSSGNISAEAMTKKQIQEALKNAGYYDGTVDGKIGPKSKTAIMDFQRDNDLKVDGVAGRNTKEKLLKYI